MAIFDDDDLNYINTQFSTLATSVDYDEQEQHDPWRLSLTPDSILHGIELPTLYNDYYVLLSNDQHSPLVTVSGLKHLLETACRDSVVSEKIISLIYRDRPSPESTVSRVQFDLALALLACKQHGLDLSLETVYRKRFDLPMPEIPDANFFTTTVSTSTSTSTSTRSAVQDTTPSTSYHTSPWQSTASPTSPRSISQQHEITHNDDQNGHNDDHNGHDDDDDDDDDYTMDSRRLNQRRNINGASSSKNDTVKGYQWYLDMDLITVSLIPQKEGRLFKYVKYLVSSQHGATTVTRRFNEFYLLWESLLKRYPLRSVPDLPPKKIKANEAFLEKRRRGLAQFMNTLERHPVLSKDELVQAFLSYQDLHQWWKQHQPSMDDEFIRTMPAVDTLRSNIPRDMTDRLKRMQQRIMPAIERYDKMITAIQRLTSNEQGEANDLIRYSITLSAMDEEEQQKEHQSTCHPCQRVIQGQEKVAHSMQTMARLLDDKAISLTNTFTEHLHYHRHLFVAFKGMLDRKDQLLETIADQQHTIPKSIAAQMIIANRPTSSSSSSSSQLSPTMIYQHQRQLSNEQIDIILQRDHIRESLNQHRMLFIHSCLASELTYLHKQQAFISLMYQDLVRQQHQWASQQYRHWKSLQQKLDLPEDPDVFI